MKKTDHRPPTTDNQLPTPIPHWIPPKEPSWERARDYAEKVRESCIAIIQLGAELDALKEQWFDVGGRPKGNSGQGCPEFSEGLHPTEVTRGWQAKVEKELGISYKTADRIMERARYTGMIKALSEGESVEYQDSRKKLQEVKPTDELKTLAGEALREVVSGTASAQRAWAGVVGEGTRRTKGETLNRAAPDYRNQIAPCCTTLATAFSKWTRLDWSGEHAKTMQHAADRVMKMLRHLPECFRPILVDTIVATWSKSEIADLAVLLNNKTRVK